MLLSVNKERKRENGKIGALAFFYSELSIKHLAFFLVNK